MVLNVPTSPLAVTAPGLWCSAQDTSQSLRVHMCLWRFTEPLFWVSCKLELFGAESAEPIVDEGQELSLEVFLRNGV